MNYTRYRASLKPSYQVEMGKDSTQLLIYTMNVNDAGNLAGHLAQSLLQAIPGGNKGSIVPQPQAR